MDGTTSSFQPRDAQASIQLTTNQNLSILYRILRTLIRPFRPRLVRPGNPVPAGSPKLSPPKTKCAIHERQVDDLYVYDLTTFSSSPSSPDPRKPTESHHIFYFAGGGFQSTPSSEHWKLCTELCIQLKDIYQVTLVSYPLAPNSPAPESLPALQKWLRSTLSDAALEGHSVTLMGDSAGANIALSLGLWWASNVSNGTVQSTLKNVVAISPATDLRNENPAMSDADKYDPVLTIKMTSDIGKIWAESLPLDHPDVSPVMADPNLFRKAGIKVHGVVGTHDVLAPDAIKFRESCNKAGVIGEWLEWAGQMHCFPLAFCCGLQEGKCGKDWILRVLRRNV